MVQGGWFQGIKNSGYICNNLAQCLEM